ncbi:MULTISPECIES: type II toxin-antitoxin system RelE/ParE family toxin [unclassified Staphylococcus]|uniref:type II toxin-antitoxin system RelE/ParE family toxin n=1 Tax=unclassified Staphylococcus TaxID=91994 RepID=UPI0021D0F624|nr:MULTISPECIES: type II toxin-antitoxin system RelE/ParE family toxin [unclassified Staphylococcus]UXR77753.1 type II toxin-antitoxin system RelE/ParE family toxin [Staphylococcus sp. IVB6227]UXR81912.1 type II toxin-antitoxin system RelE/ParE family toxin [Staphylococcus sp. IVB6214]
MDKYKIRLTKQAKEHLTLIREYIVTELKAPSIAKQVLNLLKFEIYSLETMPQRFKCIEEVPWRDLGFRKFRVKNYYIYFQIDDKKKEVQIIAIIYIKMDQERQLKNL